MHQVKFTKRRIFSAIIVLIISILAQFVIPNSTKKIKPKISLTSSVPTVVKVKRVIDGDTIEIETGQKVRYIGMDTPELHDPRKPIQCFAQEAYLKNKELIEGKTIRLEKDISETDKYGRLLRYIYLQENNATTEAIFINNYLVENGYAFVATFPPDVKFAGLFVQSQQKARNNHAGLWNNCQ